MTQTDFSIIKNFFVFAGAGIVVAAILFLTSYIAAFSIPIMAVFLPSVAVATLAVGTYTAQKDYYNRGYDVAYREVRSVRDEICLAKLKNVCVAAQKDQIKNFEELYKYVKSF